MFWAAALPLARAFVVQVVRACFGCIGERAGDSEKAPRGCLAKGCFGGLSGALQGLTSRVSEYCGQAPVCPQFAVLLAIFRNFQDPEGVVEA